LSTRKATTTLLLVAALGAGVGACGDDTSDPIADFASTPVPATTVPATTTTATTAAKPSSGKPIQKLPISTDVKTKPTIDRPSGDPPSKLYKRDIVKGKGKAAKAGDNVSVQYVGVSYSNGEQFDASWDAGKAFQFQLGAQMVIPGWDKGVAGMRKGGRRMLVIPPDLAYGSAGQGSIAPNETLIFVIDLEKIA
jgi:peptidylprolyl isomerase